MHRNRGGSFLGGGALAIALLLVYGLAFSVSEGVSRAIERPHALTCIFLAVYAAVVLLVIKRRGLADRLGLGLPARGDGRALAPYAALLSAPAAAAFMSGGGALLPFDGVLVLLALGVAFFEELFFRGYLIYGLCDRFGLSESRSAVMSAALFGALHMVNALHAPFEYTVFQALYALFIGVCFGFLRIHGRSIVPCVGVHFLINVTSAQLILYSIRDLQLILLVSVFNALWVLYLAWRHA